MSWIKLSIHPEHDKVCRLADLTGASNEAVFCAAVRWFKWVDEHAESNALSVTKVTLKTITRWPDDRLAEAMTHPDVDWLAPDNGLLRPTRWETHMSQGAKVRGLTAKRQADKRSRNSNANSVTKSAPREEKEKENTDNHPITDSDGIAGVSVGDVLDATNARSDSTPTVRMIDALVGCGFSHGRSVQLAGNPWLTEDRLQYIIDLTDRKRAENPAWDVLGGIAAGIRDKYEKQTAAAKLPASEYKPPVMGRWSKDVRK